MVRTASIRRSRTEYFSVTATNTESTKKGVNRKKIFQNTAMNEYSDMTPSIAS